jgi:formamidopyrimidine-DNA glycosylase
MDGKVVVGVGNIYAAESLFRAGIRPGVAAHRVSRLAYQLLAEAIRQILANAINVGGTTLRDFVGSDGQPGYFKQSLYVYGRQDEACRVCGSTLKLQILGQRSTVYCPSCQTFSGWKTPVC